MASANKNNNNNNDNEFFFTLKPPTLISFSPPKRKYALRSLHDALQYYLFHFYFHFYFYSCFFFYSSECLYMALNLKTLLASSEQVNTISFARASSSDLFGQDLQNHIRNKNFIVASFKGRLFISNNNNHE